jgi:preprotein translocase subunit SecE
VDVRVGKNEDEAGAPSGPDGSERRVPRYRRFAKVGHLAKVNPGEFIRQVRAETAKVVWPTRRETVTTAIMVVIMTLTLGLFFFGVDAIFSQIVQFLLSLASKG